MTKDFLGAIAIALITSGVWPVVVPKLLERKNRKQTEVQERREHERDEWMREAQAAYERVQGECAGFRREIERLRREEIEPLKRDNAAMKDALLDRIEALDEVLPFITSLPDEKIRELRASNRAHRQAVFRGRL